jgi:MFS family permease
MRNETPRYKSYLVSVLSVILAFNFLDRIAVGLVLEDIKFDLSLSDTQLGLLSGIAFALFYSVLGIPIARWADRGNRVTIIWVTTALWSIAVALCGIAGTFFQLLLVRIVVGVGEAGCAPPANSLIADSFTRAERPRAVSRYMQGMSGSVLIGYFAVGWLTEFYGWRRMFVIISLPGLALAGIAALTLREPRRSRNRTTLSPTRYPSFQQVCMTLWASTTFRHLLYAYSILLFFSYGSLQWTPTFFVRSFGLNSGVLGTWFSVAYGVGAVLGTYFGGEWAARRAAQNECLQLKAMALATGVSAIFSAFIYLPALTPNYYWAFGWLWLCTLTGVMINGPTFAMIQTLVPPDMRAMAIAIVYLCANLVGMGLGPWATGALSDALHPWTDQESLRYALLFLCPGYFWVSWHLWRASKTVFRDLRGIELREGDTVCDDGSRGVGGRIGTLTSDGNGLR